MRHFAAETCYMLEIQKKIVKCVVVDDFYVTSFTLVAIYHLTQQNIPKDNKCH